MLSRLVPERVLAPLAIDEARAWILLPDGGTTRVRDADLARAPLHWFGMLLDPSPVGVGG